MATFEQYNQWRSTLLELLGRAEQTARSLSLTERADGFKKLQDILKNDTLRIQVVGTVKNGKSSFTNALIGEEILPVDDIPCTAVVSEVKYGADKKAVVHFCSPLPAGLLNEIPAATRAYIEKHNYGKMSDGKDIQIPPLEVPYNELGKYVAIPEPTMDILTNSEKLAEYKAKIDKESPYDVAELYYPAELLRNGTDLVDSPGLNESPKRTVVTLNYLEKADAAIYLLDASKPFTEEEAKVVKKRLLKLGFTDLLMVANRIDLVRNRDRQRLYIQALAEEYTTNKTVFAVSAKEALEGMEKKDSLLLEKSGIPKFKQFLTDYLTRVKGIVKIKKPANQVNNIITCEMLATTIPNRLDTLNTESSTLQARLNQALPELTALKAKRENMANTLDRNVSIAVNAVQNPIRNFYEDLEKSIDTWISAFTPEQGWVFFPSKKDKQKVAEQILEHVKNKTTEFYELWNVNTFQGILTQQAEFAFGSMENDVNSIAENINAIENILQGVDPNRVPDISATERIAGIAAMLFLPLGRAGGDVFAGGFDFSRFMKTFAADLGIGIGVGLVALWVWPPLGFIAAIIGALAGLFKGGDHATKKTKEAVAAHIKQALQENADQQIKDVVNKVRETFNGLKYAILKGIDTEIDNVSVHVEEIRNITTNGQRSIAQKRQQLENARTELNSVSEGITNLLSELEKSQNEATHD